MSKTIGQAGLKLIKEFEGCRLTAYKCPAGVWTIGYGHTAGVKAGMTITQAQADQFLIADCQKFANYVDNVNFVPVTKSLNANQRDALISFAFNCGAGNLKSLCRNRTVAQIGNALLNYNKAKGKVLAGLTRRRKAEKALFYTAVTNKIVNTEEYHMPTIKYGSKGKAVKIWQIIVDVEPDGDFGPDTEEATRKFQQKKNLTVDGIVGSKSWNAGLCDL